MSTRFIPILFLAAVCLGAGAVPAGALEVEEAKPGDASEPIGLEGVNRSGTEYACVQGWGIFDGPVDTDAIRAMQEWGIDTVRIPLNESCWLAVDGVAAEFAGAVYREAVVGFVDRLRAQGMTVVLDLHWSAAEGPATGQQPMANRNHSVAFWSGVARTFAGRLGVIFDVFNEPHSIGWNCWRDGCGEWAGMQDLVDAIRHAGAHQPIIVTGLEWGNDLRGWLRYRPFDPLDSLVAGFHVYDFNRCRSAECWDREVAPVAAEVPVVITEFGATDCTGDWAESLMSWADRRNVSYIAWAWNAADCAGGPSLIESYDGTPSGFGAALRRHLTGNHFVDDDGSVHEPDIDRMAAEGVTHGCNPPVNHRFCPGQRLTREQGAAFFARVFTLPGSTSDTFVDDDSSLFEQEIQAVAAAGITRGCDPPVNRRFCGQDPITRGQWASFMVRALELDPPTSEVEFLDTVGHVHESDIERLAAAGLTRGCNPPRNDRFCPDDPVTRAQAASFFARVLDRR